MAEMPVDLAAVTEQLQVIWPFTSDNYPGLEALSDNVRLGFAIGHVLKHQLKAIEKTYLWLDGTKEDTDEYRKQRSKAFICNALRLSGLLNIIPVVREVGLRVGDTHRSLLADIEKYTRVMAALSESLDHGWEGVQGARIGAAQILFALSVNFGFLCGYGLADYAREQEREYMRHEADVADQNVDAYLDDVERALREMNS